MNKLIKAAVLIDGDNVSAADAPKIFAEIDKYGAVGTKRIYGDWSGSHLHSWKEMILKYAIEPVHQFAYTKGKNATDIAMVIDAMDLLYGKEYDGFFLVSGDSDFAPLAIRLRAGGVRVYGFGRKNTALSFQQSCDKFVYIGNDLQEQTTSKHNGEKPPIVDKKALPKKIKQRIISAVKQHAGEDGWTHIGVIGSELRRGDDSFDYRTYGYSNLSAVLGSMAEIKLKKKENNYICRLHSTQPAPAPAKIINADTIRQQLMLTLRNKAGKNGWVKLSDIEAHLHAFGKENASLVPADCQTQIRKIKGIQIAAIADASGEKTWCCRKIPYMKLITLVKTMVEKYQNAEGWTALSTAEEHARYHFPYKRYGFKTFAAFLATVDNITITQDAFRFNDKKTCAQ